MTPEQWEKVTEIYHAASELEGDARTAYLAEACNDDDELRGEVESLMAADLEAGDFISEPVVEGFARDLLKTNGLSAGDSIGHYSIVSKIGTGGMGEVFLASDNRLGRKVAIKTLSPIFDGDEKFLERLRNEARAAASLNHPHVATVYSVEEHDGRPFIAMEFIDGENLGDLIPEDGVEVDTFVQWFLPVVRGLEHAHARGIVHRDIKPGNIMITNDGIMKILDFGLAHFATTPSTNGESSDPSLTQTGQVFGTPAYMSPEQATGKEVDLRTDVFSLGVVMFEALTGVRPFRGDSSAEVIANLMKTDPPSVSDIRPEVPDVLARLISSCLKKKPSDRVEDMAHVKSILRETQTVSTSVLSAGSFGRRLYREASAPGWRWKAVLGVAIVVLAVLSWFYFSRQATPPIDLESMTVKRLSDGDNVGYTEISPDGKSIAFAIFEEDGTRSLWFRRIDNRNALQIVAGEQRQYWGGLAISDDGGQVYYITADHVADYGTLYRVSSLGGPPKKIVDRANDVGGLSPDGSRLLFVRYGEPSRVISVNSADGSDEKVIVEENLRPTVKTHFRDPKFSPDGQFVYYIRAEVATESESWSVESVRIEDGSVRRIYEQPQRISELTPMNKSDGLLITATDPDSNLQQLTYISVRDGSKTRVTNDLYQYFGVSVDRDDRNIVVSQRADQQRIWVGDAAEPASLRPLPRQPRSNRAVEWTPDGRLVFDGFENNTSDIWISEPDGKNLQKLTETDGDDTEPAVSGDGRFVIFTSRRYGRNLLWRMDIDGGNQLPLAEVEGITQHGKFLADGRTVLFEWMTEKNRTLATVDVGGGPVREFLKIEDFPGNVTYYSAASPDGKQLAVSIWDTAAQRLKIAVRPMEGGDPAALLTIWPYLIFKWSPDSKSLLYRERQTGSVPENEVRAIDPEKGKSELLLSTDPDYVTGIAYSRDGKKVAVVRGKNTSNAVILTISNDKR